MLSSTLNEHGAPEITPQDFKAQTEEVVLVDVRRPEEFNGELSHIEGAKLITLETDLQDALPGLDGTKTHVFVCRSGARSSRATLMAKDFGLQNSFNLKGGMLLWNTLQFPVEKS